VGGGCSSLWLSCPGRHGRLRAWKARHSSPRAVAGRVSTTRSVRRGARHPRAPCGRKEPTAGPRRAPGARALYGFVLSGGAGSCPPRLARQGQDARGTAGRDEWSASDGASLRATSGGGGPRDREAGSERAARSARRGGAWSDSDRDTATRSGEQAARPRHALGAKRRRARRRIGRATEYSYSFLSRWVVSMVSYRREQRPGLAFRRAHSRDVSEGKRLRG
jgi:hypothetical protein